LKADDTPRGGKEDAIYNVERIVGKKGWNNPPWSTAFPNFPKYMNENPFAQSYGSMLNNYHNRVDPKNPYNVVHIHGSWSLISETGEKVYPSMKDMPGTFKYDVPQKIDIATAFADPRSLDFTFKPGFKPMPGFKACDLSKVGLFKSEFRANPPSQKEYRRALYERFKTTPSSGGKYNPDKAYLRYPTQPWVKSED